MGWEVRVHRSDGATPYLYRIRSHPDALTHARILLSDYPTAVVEVRELGSDTGIAYRLTDEGMVLLHAKAAE